MRTAKENLEAEKAKNNNVLASNQQGQKIGSVLKTPSIDIRFTTKSIILIVMITLISVLLVDLYVVESKKIPRIIGKLFPSLFAYQFVLSVKKNESNV
jgi:phage-related protein